MNEHRNPTDNRSDGAGRRDAAGTGHIIFRLAAGHGHDAPDLREVAQQDGLGRLRSFLERHPRLSAQRLIRHAGPASIRRREAAARHPGLAPLETLTAYWRLDVRGDPDAERLRRELLDMPGEVAVAYHESAVTLPSGAGIHADTNPFFAQQGYLEAAPRGIGARGAWQRMGEQFGDVRVIDLEVGWILAHEDLPGPRLLYGDDGVAHGYAPGDHGAAAMGVIGGVDNQLGVIGIVPRGLTLDAVSHYDAAANDGLHVADAIGAAMQHLQAGDVLLLEVQRQQGGVSLPTEIDSADFHAIRLACAHGIVVVEAAGNGMQDLDAWADPAGEHELEVGAPGFRDSGAIMVGSCKAAVAAGAGGVSGHQRYYTSNHGSRVDVHAWGERIYTAGYGTAAGQKGSRASYASNFGETSGASAIIAGAVALVQSWRRARHGAPLSPGDLRRLLSDSATGTPQVLQAGDPIGVMPDLEAIIQ